MRYHRSLHRVLHILLVSVATMASPGSGAATIIQDASPSIITISGVGSTEVRVRGMDLAQVAGGVISRTARGNQPTSQFRVTFQAEGDTGQILIRTLRQPAPGTYYLFLRAGHQLTRVPVTVRVTAPVQKSKSKGAPAAPVNVISGSVVNSGKNVSGPGIDKGADAELFAWRSGGWSSCSAQCGPGSQERQVYCQSNRRGKVASHLCNGERPPATRDCEIRACPRQTVEVRAGTLMMTGRFACHASDNTCDGPQVGERTGAGRTIVVEAGVLRMTGRFACHHRDENCVGPAE